MTPGAVINITGLIIAGFLLINIIGAIITLFMERRDTADRRDLRPRPGALPAVRP